MKKSWLAILFPLTCFAIAAIFTLMALVSDHIFKYQKPHVSLLFLALSCIPYAVALYRMRRRYRLYYGLFELVVACGLAYATMLNVAYVGAPDPTSMRTLSLRALTFMALIYFVVRALDNIGEGLKPYPKVEAYWDKVFPKA